MKVLTLKSYELLDEDLQLEIHHSFGMEKHADHVFTPRGGKQYSATIVMEDTSEVIDFLIESSKLFPEHSFVIDDLDMEENACERLHVRNGAVREKLRTGWKWDSE